MLRESATYVVARNERWSGDCATEPLEAGWACEAVIFVRLLDPATGPLPLAYVEISPDGMHWVREGSSVALPEVPGDIRMVRVQHFGNWIRLRATFGEDVACAVLITVHLK